MFKIWFYEFRRSIQAMRLLTQPESINLILEKLTHPLSRINRDAEQKEHKYLHEDIKEGALLLASYFTTILRLFIFQRILPGLTGSSPVCISPIVWLRRPGAGHAASLSYSEVERKVVVHF